MTRIGRPVEDPYIEVVPAAEPVPAMPDRRREERDVPLLPPEPVPEEAPERGR